jgi:hypothetical protein
VIGERPVTGSCERCRQDHDLLIPEPGLGDLHLERIAERFGWCAGCDRLVGQRCCWVADAALCAGCSTDLTTPGSPLTDASLTNNALNAIAAAASSLAAAEARLGKVPVRDEDRARNAWEDAWLEAGALVVRADSAARVVRRRRQSDSDDAADRFAALTKTWKARGDAMDDRLRDVGRRIQALSVVAAPRAASNGGTADVRNQPVAERGSVTTLARPRTVPSQDVVVSPPAPAREPRANRSAGGSPRRAASDGSAAPSDRSAPVMSAPAPTLAAMPVPIANPVPETRQISPTEPLHEPELVPVPMASPVTEASPLPEVEAVPGPTTATAKRRRQRLAGATVVALALIGAGFVVATMQRVDGLGGRAGPSAESAGGDLPSQAGGPSTSVVPASSAIPPPLSAPAVIFDLEPLGPLPSDAEGVALVLGAPEVAALPTSFDRSLRLGGAGDGICLPGPPGGSAARALTVDVLIGAQLTTDLVITPVHRVEETVTVALDEIPGLAPDTWYRLHVGWDEGGAISLEVTERDAGGAVQHAALQPSTPPDHSATGSTCIEAGPVTEEAAVHLDNIRVGA